MKKFLFAIAVFTLIFSTAIFAGFTSFEKGKLFFSNGSGFEQRTVVESGTEKEYVRVLNHGTISLYESKGIKFIPSGEKKAQVFKVQPVKLEAEDYEDPIIINTPSSAVDSRVYVAENKPDAWLNADSSQENVLADLNLTQFNNYCSNDGSDCDSADMLFGETYNEFIAFDFYDSAGYKDFDSNPDADVPASVISLYKSSAVGSVISLNRSALLVQTNEQGTFFGKNVDGLPTFAAYPQFQYQTGAYDTRIAINSNIPYETITVSGNLKVAGTLSASGEFGVFSQAILSFNNGNQFSGGGNTDIGCDDYKVNMVANNVIAFGSASSDLVSGRHSEYDLYFKLYYKRNGAWVEAPYLPSGSNFNGAGTAKDIYNVTDTNLKTPLDSTGYNNVPNLTVKEMTTRAFGGSWAQDSSSLTTQFVGHLPSTEQGLDGGNQDTAFVDYRLCLTLYNRGGSVKFNNDQLQISILGLPGSTLIGVPPGSAAPIATLTLAEQGIPAGSTEQKMFSENIISFVETGGRNAPALVGYSNYLIFSQGTDYTGLEATRVQADEFYQIIIMKAIHESTPIGYDVSTGLYADGSSGSSTPLSITPMFLAQDAAQPDYALGVDALKNDNVYAPKGFDTDTGLISTTERLTSFNIGGYKKNNSGNWESNYLKIREGITFTKENYINILDDNSQPGKATTQLSLLGETSPGVSLVSKGNLSYSGSYVGTIGKMFQCQFYPGQSPNKRVVSESTNNCSVSGSSTTPMTFTIPGSSLTTTSDEVGWRMIIFGTISFIPEAFSWMYMSATINNDTGAKINTVDCNSPCSTGKSFFTGDSWDNESYQLNNFIVLDKVVANQNIVLKMNSSHTISRGPGGETSVNYGKGASISVIALPTTL